MYDKSENHLTIKLSYVFNKYFLGGYKNSCEFLIGVHSDLTELIIKVRRLTESLGGRQRTTTAEHS